MADEVEIERKFWKELRSSPFMMLGLDGERDGASQPMTAFFDNETGPLWFFTSRDHDLVQNVADRTTGSRAIATYVGKGHNLFASIHGALIVDNDPSMIDRYWSDMISAWYEGGRADPKLVLLRFDVEFAKIWLGESHFATPLRRLFGKNPQISYPDRVAEVSL